MLPGAWYLRDGPPATGTDNRILMVLEHALHGPFVAPVPGILELLGESGPMALCVLGMLGLLSIVSWGIMIERWRRFRLAERESRAFQQRASMRSGLADLSEFGKHLSH